jgi:hypothetical protein
MSQSYAALLAQIIPIIALAQVFEMREISRRATESEGTNHQFGLLVLGILVMLSMMALAIGEVWVLGAASGSAIPNYSEIVIRVSLIFGVLMTFIVPVAAWCYSLAKQLVAQKVAKLREANEAVTTPLPSRFWRWARPGATVVVGTMAILAVSAAIAIFVAFYGEPSTDAIYQAGDKPRTVQHERRECSTGTYVTACSTIVEIDAYEWSIGANQPATITTFTQEHLETAGALHHLRGTISNLASGCPGTRVEWSLRVNDTIVVNGYLDDHQNVADLKGTATDRPVVTLAARRTDDRPCTTTLRWSNPEFYDPAPLS